MAQLVRYEGADEPTDPGIGLLLMRGVIRVALYSWHLASSQKLGEAITK